MGGDGLGAQERLCGRQRPLPAEDVAALPPGVAAYEVAGIYLPRMIDKLRRRFWSL